MSDTTVFKEDTKPLLRPHQVHEMQDEKDRLEAAVNAPAYISNQIQDKGAIRTQLRRLDKQLQDQVPRPYDAETIDKAVAREAQLRAKILEGMPTQAEMRRNPAGAVDKHRMWEKRTSEEMQEWKNTRLRLHASGTMDVPEDSHDVANFEQYRPGKASHELNMDHEQIPGKLFYFPTQAYQDGRDRIERNSEKMQEEFERVERENVELRAMLEGGTGDSGSGVKAKDTKGGWTPERRKAQSERTKAMHAAKRTQKEKSEEV